MSLQQKEKNKFVEFGGETCVRVYGTLATLPGTVALADGVQQRERDKFVEGTDGTAVILTST